MKKQKDSFWDVNWKAVLILIFIILVIFGINYYLREKPNITITKNECKNQSWAIGKALLNVTTIPCEYTEIWLGCMECSKHCISKDKYEANCRNISLKCQVYQNSFIVEYAKENYAEVYEDWHDIIQWGEFCNPVEVEEIEYLGTKNKSVEVCNCGFTRCYSNGECGGQFAGIGGFDRETPVDECNQKLEEIEKESSKDKTIVSFSGLCNNNHFKDILIEVNKSIPKKLITKEWLDENCECINELEKCQKGSTLMTAYEGTYCIDNRALRLGIQINSPYGRTQKICSKYKCFSNYEVEVK